jgi:SET family sugar efflux transporter-like MFS transporter
VDAMGGRVAAPPGAGPAQAGEARPRSGEFPRAPGGARDAVPLAGAVGSYGLWSAFLATTTSLFLADALHVAPLAIGLFFTVRGVAAIVINLVAGRISDRLPDRRLMLAIAGAGGAGAGLCFAVLRDYPAVLVLGAVCYSVGGIAYSQLFAYTSELAQAAGRAVTTFTSVMRSVFSASWVLGPPLGLFLLTRYGFGPLYLATAGLSLATGVLGQRGLRRIPARPAPAVQAAARGRGPGLGLPARIWLLLGAVILLSAVNQMYNIDVALYVTRDLGMGAQFVGWMAGLSAALEVPLVIMAGRLADRVGKLRVTLAAAAGATVFFCLLPLATTAPALLALQPLNAAWTAVALSIPMVMVQQEAPGGVGAAAALYGSAFMAAVMLAGAVTGVTATALGYGNVFWVCAALSAAGGGLLLARTVRPPLRSYLRPAPGRVPAG